MRTNATMLSMSAPADGFAYTVRGGDVAITHRGRVATTLRGRRAERFIAEVEDGDAQQLMARITGNYKRGNEPTAKQHRATAAADSERPLTGLGYVCG